uniref:Uncharacterized protein n=1 Tax=Romanomermis culicivorax TaxID=13658 RepID=A0A915HQF9_ROMCU
SHNKSVQTYLKPECNYTKPPTVFRPPCPKFCKCWDPSPKFWVYPLTKLVGPLPGWAKWAAVKGRPLRIIDTRSWPSDYVKKGRKDSGEDTKAIGCPYLIIRHQKQLTAIYQRGPVGTALDIILKNFITLSGDMSTFDLTALDMLCSLVELMTVPNGS